MAAQMDVVARIQLNLAMVRVSISSGISKLLQRGETAERIEQMADAVAASGKAFELETERRVSTPWQRCCGRGRWIDWVFPCVPLWRWLQPRQRCAELVRRCSLLLDQSTVYVVSAWARRQSSP